MRSEKDSVGVRLFSVALMLLVASSVEAQSDCSPGAVRHVSASGSATIKLAPDRAAFSVGVETRAATVPQALTGNTAKLAAVLSALKAKGVAAAEIQTSQMSIESARDDDGKRLTGFQVSNRVSVVRSDPAGVGPLLEAAVGAGANWAGGFRLFVADATSQRERGLELAFQDARARASALARLSGGTLGSVLCSAEGGYSTTRFGGTTETVSVAAEPLTIEAGLEEISFSVYVVFELR